MSKIIKSFSELDVYRLAFELQQEIFELTKSFPPDERFSLTSQIRRASRSIGANICEAWHKRRYPLHFVSKLTDSDGEQAETQHWLCTSLACDYIDMETCDRLLGTCNTIGGKLGKMMEQPEKWCSKIS